MGIIFHQDAIVERAWFALVRVEAKVYRPWMILRQERPLQTRRKARSTTPAEVAFLHHLDDFAGGEIFQRFAQRLIPAARCIRLERVAVGFVDVGQQYGFEFRHGFLVEG